MHSKNRATWNKTLHGAPFEPFVLSHSGLYRHVHTVHAFTARTTRTVPKKIDDEDEDDEDFGDDDSFINDDSEDAGDDSDYAPPISDDSGKEDIKGLQKEAKAFTKKRK